MKNSRQVETTLPGPSDAVILQAATNLKVVECEPDLGRAISAVQVHLRGK